MKKTIVTLLSLITAALLLMASSAEAQYEDAFQLSVQERYSVILGSKVSLDISITKGGGEVVMFDFLLGFDRSALTVVDVTPGSIYDEYEWEYFTYRVYDNDTCQECPSGLLRIYGFDNHGANTHVPTNIDLKSGDSFARINFKLTNSRNQTCNTLPVRWLWTTCGDNLLTGPNYSDVYASRKVRDHKWSSPSKYIDHRKDLTDIDSLFPTLGGMPTSCTDAIFAKQAMDRKVDFINGGVFVICDDFNPRGDINYNGLANELDDAKIFANYFTEGYAAFPNRDAGIVGSETNGDGIPLTVSDLVYLISVINADALPVPYVIRNPVEKVDLKIENGIVSTKKALGGVFFMIEGTADVRLLASNMKLQTGIVDGNTHVLVYPPFQRASTESIETDEIIWTNGKILKIEASDPNGAPLGASVELPETFALYQNFPNPFNPVTTIRFDLTEKVDAKVEIYNVSGQMIESFNGPFAVGRNEVVWDASKFASGVYLYKVTAGVNSQSRKMVLLK